MRLLFLQKPAHLHQRQAQQVLPGPCTGVRAPGVAHGDADAPDRVVGVTAHEDLIPGGEELLEQVSVLFELTDQPPKDDDLPGAMP